MKYCFLVLACLSLSFAQPPGQTPQFIQSPVVNPNRSVTFRFLAPNAQKVSVYVEGQGHPFDMEKGAQGIWSATTPPLAPQLYGYSFTADGVGLLDPSNSSIIRNLLNPSSMLHVPGPTPEPWEDTDIPHGIIHHHFYKSAIVGDNRDFYVYTPPGYDSNAKTTYPVLYLLHGYSDDASAWTSVGKANLILDTLLAEGKIKPMIVVMPLGYGAPEIVQHTAVFGAPFRDQSLRERNFNRFRDALITEVIPQVEKTYRAASDRDDRAIAGLSMGGAESLLTGLNRLDEFGWVGSFSAGGLSDDFTSDFPQLTQQSAAQLHLLWIACGTEDHLITLNRNLVTWLKAKDIKVNQIETPGMHEWPVWRNNLIALTPLLFR